MFEKNFNTRQHVLVYLLTSVWYVANNCICKTSRTILVVNQKENPVVFTGGVLKPGVDKEPPSKQKKWAMPGNALGNAVYIPDK